MKTALDTARGRIVGYDERRGELLVRVPYDDYHTLVKREYRECLVQLVDSRPLSDAQRKMCYALLGEIAEFSGMGREMTKTEMKIRFKAGQYSDLADTIFSLSNAPMSLVCEFQRFLIRFILDYDIPCGFPLLDYADDIPDYIYHCLITKKCCVCGRPCELHHVERVGMGRSRAEIVHEGMEALPLCREHHAEAHTMPDEEFFARYHLPGGVPLDRTLCRMYRLKRKKEDAT